MATMTGSPTMILHGQKLAGGWLIYIGLVLSVGSAMTLLRAPADLGIGLLGLGIGAALLAYCAGLALQEVRIYGEGFVWRRFGREDEVRWNQVRDFKLVQVHSWTGSGFVLRITLQARASARAQNPDGDAELVLSNLADAEDLRRYLNTFCRGAAP
jgi:hypothetical protein